MLMTSAASAADQKSVSFREKTDNQLEILIGDQVLGVFNHGAEWNKPFIFPMHAPNGQNILRDIIPTAADQGSSKEGTDHFHHKGVWVSVDSVNEEMLNFWHEKDRIVCESVEASTQHGNVQLKVTNAWMQDDQPLLKEHTTITFYPSRLVTYHIELAAVDRDVTFHDTKEGFFAVRIAHTMREMNGGRITNADGLKGEKECWGKPTPWIDYCGEVNGKTCGVALMDHPGNFRESRYHVRSYGLFSISPFGPKKYSNGQQPAAPVTISPGKDNLVLNYGMYVHDGETADAGVEGAYKEFLKVTK
jgi:hypothetical protein